MRKTLNDLTILYITDSALDPFIAEKCREYLLWAADGVPIVSVSQEPIDFGENICVGKLDRVAVSIDTQLLAGLEAIDTRFVAVAEHDCLYRPEHFRFRPIDDELFYYNDNCWLVQYKGKTHPEYDNMYSYFRSRNAQSQLICNTDRFRKSETEKLAILSHPDWFDMYPRGRIGEPGANILERTRKLYRGVVRRSDSKSRKELGMLWKRIKRYITVYNAVKWATKDPNLDIRHGNNFSGNRRGSRRTWDLKPWGKFEDVLNGSPR